MRFFRLFWFKHYLGQRFQWYRRWYGGRWECWWIDICGSFIWLDVTPPRVWPQYRQPCGRGRPEVEDWPAKIEAHPCPNGHCKLGIDGKLSERCIVGCWKALKEGIPK